MANKQFKVPINLVNLASDPGTASEGDVYYNTTSDTVKVYANGAWASIGSGGGGSSTLDGLTDVTITSVADNEVLAYDTATSQWINQTASEAGLATTAGNLSQFAATTSSQLLGVISDETGTGSLVFGTSPTFTTSVIGGATFSAFATTDNLTIGESTGYSSVNATNNILSGGTIEGLGGIYTVTDNYSSRNLYGNGGDANYVINIGNGTYSQSGEGEIAKTINIATTSKTVGELAINIGTQYGSTTLYGSVSLPSTTTIAGATIAGATFTGDIVFEGATSDNFETTLTVTDPTADRTITIPNATGTVALTSDLSSYAALSGATFTGNIAINNSTSTALTTTGTTAAVFNTNATTLNIGGASTTLSIGAATGTTTINNNLALSAAVSIAASKNIAVASFYNGTFGTGRVIMTGTGSNPTTRPDGTSLVAGDIWIAF